MRSAKLWGMAVLTILMVCRSAGATGLLVPSDKSIPPLGVKSHRVNVQIKDGVAQTKLTEVFYNATNSRLEATFVFPIPAEAALTDFAMYINGKRESGQVVEAAKARQVYEDIVRRMRDPGLLEYMGRKMLQMRVFPIEPNSTQKIEVTYSCALPFDNGVYYYVFPLNTGDKASRVLEDSTFGVEITSTHALANVYSPSHKVGVTRKGDHSAVVGFEEERASLDKDFALYFTVADKDFGLNLLTYRVKGQDGYFALMLAPRVELKDDEVMAKDVCFLVDVSGSMLQEDRIGSAKAALKFCLKSLSEKDRFALVPFSTGVETFGEGLMEAKKDNVEKALACVDKLEARGGTALCGALLKGLEMAPEGTRPYIVVLITDGKPTIGVTEPADIIAELKKANKVNVRVFSFGIAEQLDVPLLDGITETTKGYSEYVSPGREIEAEISAFFRKVSSPVLAALKLEFGKVKVTDMYPQTLPDLFRGSQLMVFGRYSGGGDVAVQLKGAMKGKEQTFAFDAAFPAETVENAFIPHLWAQRKIAYLLDEIRLHGENKELVDEVVRLSKEFGIATPYTSYLVLENEQAYVQHGIMRSETVASAMKAAAAGPAAMPSAVLDAKRKERQSAAEKLDGEAMFFAKGGAPAGAADAEGFRSGERAVNLSQTMREWKDADREGGAGMTRVQTTLKRVGDKTFVQIHGVFVDTEYKDGLKELKLKWGSDAYFAALRALPKIKDYLSLGERVIVVIEGKALIVGDEGQETFAEAAVREFFAK